MFDITTVREINYGANDVAYVYQDHDNPRLWYMVPVPTLRTVNGAPAFSLVEYAKNGGGLSGACTFEMELIQPPAAREAAKKVLGDDISWGGFTWVGGTAYFHYDIAGETEVLAVEPTLYGTNVAAFQIPLATAEALNTFKAAYSEGGGASPFRVEYDMQVLTKLLGAKATVKYDAEAAVKYENKYKTVRDTWGNQKQVLQDVKQVLLQSGAGLVKVEIGPGSTPELEQRVRDWGWTTLENQVASTVAAAATMATGPNPVSATTSFQQTYLEDTVIDWSTPVSSFMRKFSTDEWHKLFLRVDNRKLGVVFSLIGQLKRTDNGEPVAESVLVTVDYPTRNTDNTFRLIVTDGNQSSMIYEAPGDFTGGHYNPQYTYSFVIHFKDGKSYQSDKITTTDTLITITPNVFGTRQVKFIGQGVPFVCGSTGTVKAVNIDFFFAPPVGNPAIVQTKTLRANDEDGAVTFDSYYMLPIGHAYTYRLRYQLSDNSEIVSQPPGALSSAPDNTNSGNANIVFVKDPKGLFTQFTLRAFNYPTEPTTLVLVDVNVQYFDLANHPSGWLFENTWSNWQPEGFLSFAEPRWNFQAVDNKDSAYYNISGTVYYSDGSNYTLSDCKQTSANKALAITNTIENYSVLVDTSSIDWAQVAGVTLTMFQLTQQARDRLPDTLPDFFTKPREEMTREERAVAEGSQYNLMGFVFIGPTDAERVQPGPTVGARVDHLKRYYGLQRPRNQPRVEFYYTAVYVMKQGGEQRVLRDQKVDGKLSIELPAFPPPSVTPGIVHHSVDPAALAAHMRGQG